MSNIVRASSGEISTGSAGGNAIETGSEDWTVSESHIWWDLEDLPRNIIEKLNKKDLFPNGIYMAAIDGMEMEKVSGKPMDVIHGWMIGRDSMSSFRLVRDIGETSDESWKVLGKRHIFKEPSKRYEDTFQSDNLKQTDESVRGGSNMDPFNLGHEAYYLPIQARKYLLTVQIPVYSNSIAFGRTGEFVEHVKVVRKSQQNVVAVHAVREHVPTAGEMVATSYANLRIAPWKVVTIRGFFE